MELFEQWERNGYLEMRRFQYGSAVNQVRMKSIKVIQGRKNRTIQKFDISCEESENSNEFDGDSNEGNCCNWLGNPGLSSIWSPMVQHQHCFHWTFVHNRPPNERRFGLSCNRVAWPASDKLHRQYIMLRFNKFIDYPIRRNWKPILPNTWSSHRSPHLILPSKDTFLFFVLCPPGVVDAPAKKLRRCSMSWFPFQLDIQDISVSIQSDLGLKAESLFVGDGPITDDRHPFWGPNLVQQWNWHWLSISDHTRLTTHLWTFLVEPNWWKHS
jgi:hypothetical protein